MGRMLINKVKFQQAVDDLESKFKFKNLQKLWEAVCQTTWAKGIFPKPLTPPAAHRHAKLMGIVVQTKPSKKLKLPIEKKELQKVVDKLESEQSFANFAFLWKAIAETPWACNFQPHPVTEAAARFYAKKLGISIKTMPGKKGGGIKRRKKRMIDKNRLQEVIDELESKQTFEGHSQLWKEVAKTPLAIECHVGAATLMIRAKEMGIVIKTQKGTIGKGKKRKYYVDKDELQKVISDLESQNNYGGRSDLWRAVSETSWAIALSLKPSVVYHFAKQYNLNIKAPAGKKPRKRIPIDKDRFQEIITNLESKRHFKRQRDLWEAVCDSEWNKNLPRPMKPGSAKARADEMGLVIRTRTRHKRISAHAEEGAAPSQYAEFLDKEYTRKTDDDRFNGYDWIDYANNGIRHNKAYRFVAVPSGNVRAKLAGTEPEMVESWCAKVLDHGVQDGLQYGRSALMQFARQFYDIHQNEYRQVVDSIKLLDPEFFCV